MNNEKKLLDSNFESLVGTYAELTNTEAKKVQSVKDKMNKINDIFAELKKFSVNPDEEI